MLRHWFLIQTDLGSSALLHSNYDIRSLYYCLFLENHPEDKRLSDKFGRWWSDWYDSVSNDVIFGDIILFRPNVTPNSVKYIQWSDEVILRPAPNILLGPFNFEGISSANCTQNKVDGTHWRDFHDKYSKKGVLPPTTGSLTFNALTSPQHN